jgi:hypothetical protein
LRREAGAGTPEFRDILAGLARRRGRAARRRRRVAVLAAAAVAALVLFGVVRPSGQRAALVDLAAAHWEAPTDFLLRTPAAELLRTLPTLTTDGRIMP